MRRHRPPGVSAHKEEKRKQLEKRKERRKERRKKWILRDTEIASEDFINGQWEEKENLSDGQDEPVPQEGN